MTARGRGYSQSHDWESTRDDYNSSTYDPQYPDDNTSGGVQLDHCRLYVTSIPRALNEEGLRAAFSKYGMLLESHLSKDPTRKYGLVKYETPGEAKLAMMKMNRTEPLKLNVSIAHKTRGQDEQRKPSVHTHDRPSTNGMRERSVRDDASVVSRNRHSRKQEEVNNGDEMDDIPMDDDFGYNDTLDPHLHLELENLKLEQLKLREEQLMCKHRMILLKQADKKPPPQSTVSNRCILPDGKIVVRNIDRAGDSRDADVSYAGAGDSSVCSRSCVGCGLAAAAYCAGCGVTPYCGERCQRRDWPDRHHAVCHNLARLSGSKERNYNDAIPDDATIPPAAPLRPPHASPPVRREHRRDDDSGSDNTVKAHAYKNTNNKGGNNSSSPRKNFMNKRPQGEMRRPNVKRNAETQDEEWTPKKFDPTPATPPVNTQKPSFNKVNNDTLTYKSTKEPEPIKATNHIKEPTKPAVVKQAVRETTPVPKQVVQETTPVVKQAVGVDVAPVKDLVPNHYLIETLDIGDSVLLSVDALAADCRSKREGYICLAMSEQHEEDYQLLCESFGEACAASSGEYKPAPGETCAYLDPADGGWYRARCLSAAWLALLDASRLAAPAAGGQCRPLPTHYRTVPEFCCLLRADGVQVGVSLTCKLLSKTAEGYRVSIDNNETGATVGEGELLRWLPAVDYPPTAAPANTVAPIPTVSRPDVTHGSRVLLVHATAMDQAFVRPAVRDSRRKYDDVLEQVALCGKDESPLEEPPIKGQTVLGQFEDGVHYRALCKRTNVKQNKYLLEYIEFGNMEISPLDKLFPCPAHLSLAALPTLVSRVSLQQADDEFTPPALEYVEFLKQDGNDIILTIPSGAKTAASGSVVQLHLADNKDNINKKIIDMCAPEWKKIEERGGDVIETKRLMYSDLEFLELPAGGCTVDVLDVSMLEGGIISACQQNLPHAGYVLNQLTQKMGDYCNSEIGRQPYLPREEELCIAQFPPYPQWLRAVLAKQVDGPGGRAARVCYLDYGNVAAVPVALLRKMLPEFIVGLPVLASHLMIKDFPEEPSPAMLERARAFLRVDAEGRGELSLERCLKQDDGDIYLVDAPRLLAHMHAL